MRSAERTRTPTKPFRITRRAVLAAYQHVKANRGGAGIDGQTLAAFETQWQDHCYRLWNRLSSGSYEPPPVRTVEIPKKSGGVRRLGIPTIVDRIAQQVVRQHIEPRIEPHFHSDSYGYRPRKSARDAVRVARQRCWTHDWVVDLDIRSFFDTLRHDLLMTAVRKHVPERWCLLYIERWLHAPSELADGTRVPRTMGSPQGGVISPLLSNLYLHYVFDAWMRKHYPAVPFERYADDVIVHCKTAADAQAMRAAITARMADCGLTVHPNKTKIVYCKDSNRRGTASQESFDFLGFTFRPRGAKNRKGQCFTSFSPGMSRTAQHTVRAQIRTWKLPCWTGARLEDLAATVNPVVRGWLQYYGAYHRSVLYPVMRQLERALQRWVQRTYRDLRQHQRRAAHWLQRVRTKQPTLFAHWQLARWCGVNG